MPQRSRRSRYQGDAEKAADKHGVPRPIFLSMVHHESGWNPGAVSGAGAIGLGQLMPGTARGLGVDPWNPRQNLDGAARYLRGQYESFGNWKDALRAYNQGPGGARAQAENGLEYATSVMRGRSQYGGTVPRRPLRVPPKTRGQTTTEMNLPGLDMEELANVLFADDPGFLDIARQVARTVDIPDRDARRQGLVSPGGSVRRVQLPPGDLGKLVGAAQSQLGKPYVFGSGPSTESFDCSDLIQWAYRQIGISIPRVTFDQIKAGRSVKGEQLQAGDLWFSSPGHVMMYVGGGKLISAPYTGTVVQYKNVSDYGTPYEVRRVLDDKRATA